MSRDEVLVQLQPGQRVQEFLFKQRCALRIKKVPPCSCCCLLAIPSVFYSEGTAQDRGGTCRRLRSWLSTRSARASRWTDRHLLSAILLAHELDVVSLRVADEQKIPDKSQSGTHAAEPAAWQIFFKAERKALVQSGSNVSSCYMIYRLLCSLATTPLPLPPIKANTNCFSQLGKNCLQIPAI